MSIKKPRGPSKSASVGLTEKWVSGTGQKMMVHSKSMCVGEGCPIHRPSKHHMVKWKLNWRQDRRMMERICSHGIGHPDPDDAAYRLRHFKDDDTMHGCDGCCTKKVKEENKVNDKDDPRDLTWDAVAEEYNKHNGGRRAKTLPMEEVFEWASKHKDFVLTEEGTIRRKV